MCASVSQHALAVLSALRMTLNISSPQDLLVHPDVVCLALRRVESILNYGARNHFLGFDVATDSN